MSKKLCFWIVAAFGLTLGSSLSRATEMVAGALKGSNPTTLSFTKYDAATGNYSVTFHRPTVTFFDDPGIPGVVAEKDTNPLRPGKMVWNAPYSLAASYVEGASVHVCKLQGEWFCGSGDLNKMLSNGEKPYASSRLQNGKVTITLPPSPEVLAAAKADPKIDKSIEGFTILVVPADSAKKRAWLTIHDDYRLKAATGSPAHAWVIGLRDGEITSPRAVKNAQGKFATVIKQ